MVVDFFTLIDTCNRLHKMAMSADPTMPETMKALQGQSTRTWDDFQVYVGEHWPDVMAGLLELGDQLTILEAKAEQHHSMTNETGSKM